MGGPAEYPQLARADARVLGQMQGWSKGRGPGQRPGWPRLPEIRPRRLRTRKAMTSMAQNTATAAGVSATVQSTPGCRALDTATPPKQMAVRNVPMVSRETK
jgi:hypothetical protein